jgi:hypothetical protein
MPSVSLEDFLEIIMHIDVLRMGGASAGIIGSTGTDDEVLANLKKSAIAFANEYRKPASRHDELHRLSQAIEGYLLTLQLTATLSAAECDELIDQLQTLADE